VEERRINQGFWIKDKLILVEDIPAGVCVQCGEKVVNASVGQRIAALMEDKKRLQEARTISIPVIRFTQETA